MDRTGDAIPSAPSRWCLAQQHRGVAGPRAQLIAVGRHDQWRIGHALEPQDDGAHTGHATERPPQP